MKIVGMNIEKVTGINFKGEKIVYDEPIIYADNGRKKLKIILEDDRYSKTPASSMEIEFVKEFPKYFEYIPNEELDIEDLNLDFVDRESREYLSTQFKCKAFEFISDKYVYVNLNCFTKTKYAKDKRHIWILFGKSAEEEIGRFKLAESLEKERNVLYLENMTDIPKDITEDIIVLPSESFISVSDLNNIKNNIFDKENAKIVMVQFYSEN